MLLTIATIVLIATVILATELVTLFTPLVVYGVTWIVRKFAPGLPGWVVVMLIVPLLSLAVVALTGLLGQTSLTFWQQFAYGLLAVFVNELYVQLKPAVKS